MVQIRNVPDRLHRELARRAKARGMPLTRYLEEILEREVARPPRAEVFARVRAAGSVDLGIRAAEIVRGERDARGRP
ncbi:MAG: hypothetical protein HYU87_02960 [Chloroflexi bacterium]|nr:hypothetical protein [Chloroflexota bacterium]